MRKKYIVILAVLVQIAPSIAIAQVKIGVHGNYGFSKFIEKDNEPSVVIGNSYKKLPSYSIGVDILYPLKDSKFGIASGLDFSSFASENNMPGDFDYSGYSGPTKWDERFYSLSLPVKLNYKFEEWVCLNAGLANSVHLNEPKEINMQKVNHYTLNFTGGIDFIIKKRFVIGAMYYRDIRPTMVRLKESTSSGTYNIKYSIEQITLKIGVIINSKEQGSSTQ